MDTSRAIINIYDNSSTSVEQVTPRVGFTVVKAAKGPCRPVRIGKGGQAKIKDIFGVSSKDYPELFEVETFNREYDVYVSAPYTTAEVPVAYLTKNGVVLGASNASYQPDGLEAYAMGELDAYDLTDKTIANVTSFTGTKVLWDVRYTGDFDSTADNLDISTDGPYYDTVLKALIIKTGYKTNVPLPGSFRLQYGNTKWDIACSDSTLKIGEVTVGSVSSADGYKILVITGSTETSLSNLPATYVQGYFDNEEEIKKISVYWLKDIADTDIYAVIFPKYPSDRNLHISFQSFSTISNYDGKVPENRNILKMSVYEEGAFRDEGHSIFINGSIDLNAKDGSGALIGFCNGNSSYSSQDLFCIYPRKKFSSQTEVNTEIEGYHPIVLSGGKREFGEDTIANGIKLHNKGWKMAGESEYSDVDIFFDSANHDGCTLTDLKSSYFFDLAEDDITSHELAGYIFNYTLKPEELIDDNGFVKTDLINKKLTMGRNYWNICNVGIVEDSSNGSRYSVSMTGAKSLMQCRILEQKRGGAAPMWNNVGTGTTSIGGQLNMMSLSKLKYKYNKKMLDLLDELNYNPVINDRQYGIMVTGQKTCKDGDLTDWSYIGHASAFLDFLKQVRANVMIPQIGKPNNPYYRTLRKDQVDRYLAERLNGEDRIWAEAECDTSTADGINDVYALKARKFIINVRVKVDIFSEKVVLNFTNEDQESKIYAE